MWDAIYPSIHAKTDGRPTLKLSSAEGQPLPTACEVTGPKTHAALVCLGANRGPGIETKSALAPIGRGREVKLSRVKAFILKS